MSLISRSAIIVALLLVSSISLAQEQGPYDIPCPSQRSNVCTADIRPVCAYKVVQCSTPPCHYYFTASNACGACIDSAVQGYVDGECECVPSEQESDEEPDPNVELEGNAGGRLSSYLTFLASICLIYLYL